MPCSRLRPEEPRSKLSLRFLRKRIVPTLTARQRKILACNLSGGRACKASAGFRPSKSRRVRGLELRRAARHGRDLLPVALERADLRHEPGRLLVDIDKD